MSVPPALNDSLPAAAPTRGPFVPLLLLAIAVLGWAAIQTTQLWGDRRTLAQASAQQATPLESAHKVRVAAGSLARQTQELADKGNADARAVVEALKQQGININPKATILGPP